MWEKWIPQEDIRQTTECRITKVSVFRLYLHKSALSHLSRAVWIDAADSMIISNLRLINLASKHSNVQTPHSVSVWQRRCYTSGGWSMSWRVPAGMFIVGLSRALGSVSGSGLLSVTACCLAQIAYSTLSGDSQAAPTPPTTFCPQSSCYGGRPSWRDSKPTHGEGEREMG